MLTALLEILQNRSGDIITATVDHIQLTLIALVLANLIAIPLGVLLTRYRRWADRCGRPCGLRARSSDPPRCDGWPRA